MSQTFIYLVDVSFTFCLETPTYVILMQIQDEFFNLETNFGPIDNVNM